MSPRSEEFAWHLFRVTFVEPGEIDPKLYDTTQRAQTMREDADYDAAPFSPAEAERVRDDAQRFVDTVAAMLAR